MWDNTWDEITNEKYLNVPYEKWNEGDIFKIRYDLKNDTEGVYLSKIDKSKWAWWCDFYSKEFYETIAPIPDEWIGYGGWDYYSMLISEAIKSKGADFQQYILKGQTAFEYTIGDFKNGGFTKYHKDYFSIKTNAIEQRKIFEENLPYYLNRQVNKLINENII